MKSRYRQLERLQRLREAEERMHKAALAREQSRLAEAHKEREAAELAGWQQKEAARSHLLAGDGEARLVAEQSAALCAVWQAHSEQQVAERSAVVEQAQLRWRATHLQVEQSTLLAQSLERLIQVEDDRREQSASDERYAARLHWTNSRSGT